jgi:hypothetical protein
MIDVKVEENGQVSWKPNESQSTTGHSAQSDAGGPAETRENGALG